MSNLIFFITIYLLFFISAIGYGLIFSNIFNFKVSNFGLFPIYGLILLTFISYLSIFFVPHNYYFNIIIHLIGLLIFFKNFFLKKIKIQNFFIIIILIISLSLLISKNHDDFGFYHLQQMLNFSTNKYQLGLHNLDFSYSHHSSILLLSSLYYIPIFNFYFFNASNLIFFSSIIIFFYSIYKNRTSSNFQKIFSLFFLIFFLVKFTRLSEFGTDIVGQCLIIIFTYLFVVDLQNKNHENLIVNICLFLIFCVTLKTYFITYSIFVILLAYKIKLKDIFNIIKKKRIFIIFSFCFFSLFLIFNLFNTGCLIYPLPTLCFESLIWSMPIEEVKNYQIFYEAWAKSLAGTGYVVDNYQQIISNFSWVKFWIKNYFFNKFLDNIVLILFISLIFLFFFQSKNKISKLNFKNFKLIFFAISFIFLIWFIKHPSLRYGGYAPLSLLISFPLICYLSLAKKFKYNINKIGNFLLIIAFSIFVIKNVIRLDAELNRNDMYKFTNFPFFYVPKIPYEKTYFENNIQLYQPIDQDSNCWSIPQPCTTNFNFKVKKKFNYVIFYK